MRSTWLTVSMAALAATRISAQPPPTPPAQLPPSAAASSEIPNPDRQNQKSSAAAPQTSPAPAGPPIASPCGPCESECSGRFHDTHSGPTDKLWFNGGPVLFWLKNGPGPTLAVGGGQSLAGDFDFGTFNGFALDGGMWLNCRHTLGVMFGGMLLEHRSITDTLISDPTGQPAISRPLFDVLTGRSFSALVASPGALAGGIVTGASSQFAGANAGFVANLAYSTDFTFDALFGFRYLGLEEKLDIVQTTQALSGGALVLAGMPVSALAIEDQFRTRNQFYGGQIGVRGEYRFGPAFVRGIACVSFGPNHEVINIAGQTRELGGAGASVPSGLLAAGTVGDANAPTGNIGRQITNRFTVVPELTGQIGCALTPRIRSFVGYNFLYVSDVARPGTQIDLNVNPRLIPSSPLFGSLSGPAAPRPTLIRNDFVAHGVQFGLEFHF